ncbi:MAG TPA: hypothetical protein VJ370_15320 [Streptosporangiaceae bacterium]|nr:hypothetical protein [Streptosporangiaceae bacterium]
MPAPADGKPAEGLNKRQIDENQVLNLAYSQPGLLTGVNPATGQPVRRAG